MSDENKHIIRILDIGLSRYAEHYKYKALCEYKENLLNFLHVGGIMHKIVAAKNNGHPLEITSIYDLCCLHRAFSPEIRKALKPYIQLSSAVKAKLKEMKETAEKNNK